MARTTSTRTNGRETKVVVVDMHAEITSEKTAMGWYLDGRVSAVVGTHTHIPTADERILPKGTAYITDIGMVGSLDSVIGVKKELALKRFLSQLPIRFEVEKENIYLHRHRHPETGQTMQEIGGGLPERLIARRLDVLL